MSDIIASKQQPLAAPTITNIKENTINNFNLNGSEVTFKIDYPSQNQNELMLAINRFSKEYYQLIVTGEDIFDSDANSSVTVSVDRALSQFTVPEEIFARCSSLTSDGIEELKTFPAIICSEKTDQYYAMVGSNHMAIYAFVRKIKKSRKEIKIYFQPIQLIPLRILCENPIDYGVRVDCAISDFNKSAWTVRKINLFEAFSDTGIHNMPSPM